MLIESIVLEGIGPFRERLSLGPLQAGLNVLAQPNEWGKSTVVKALSRALFDKYRSEAEEIRQLRPAGSSLCPRVELVFRCKGEKYRLVKAFLDNKCSELFRWNAARWERTDESDRADQRLRELLGAPALEGRVAKPETWGFLRYLWARQDDPASWPDWGGVSGDAARRKLATVEIDAAIRALTSALKAKAEILFTPTGKVRTGSPLEMAQEERARLTAELADLRARRIALAELQRKYAATSSGIPVLERERGEKQEEAKRVREEAEAVEKLRIVLAGFQLELERAETALQQVRRDQELLNALDEKEKLSAVEEERLSSAATASAKELPALEASVGRLQNELRGLATARRAADERLQRVRGLARLKALCAEAARLKASRERGGALAAELAELEKAFAKVPVISAAKLKAIRESERTLREERVRLEALGLQVHVHPENAGTIVVEADGAAEERAVQPGAGDALRATQSMRLTLPGWGRIEITSGAAEPVALSAEIARREAEFRKVLSELRVSSVADAEAAAQQSRDLEPQIRSARSALAAHLGEGKTLADLDAASARAEAAAEQQRLLLGATDEEAALGGVALDAEEHALAAKLREGATAEAALTRQLEEARDAVETARRRREDNTSQLAALKARVKGIADQREMIGQRYSGGLADALKQAQRTWVRAEARVEEAKRQLPPYADKLRERVQRAVRAAAEVESAYLRAVDDMKRLEVQLEERGAEGLYSRENELEEKLAWATAEAERLRQEGLAARLLGSLIQRREQSAVKTVLGPLENRLSEVFAGITGVGTRRVWFDERLQVRGIGGREEELIPFDDLSRGAREQLLLALRASIALELSCDGPVCLLLDDVLVHTDPVRQQNVLDYLQDLSAQLQIVVLTCHAERYRGAGHLLVPEWPGRSS